MRRIHCDLCERIISGEQFLRLEISNLEAREDGGRRSGDTYHFHKYPPEFAAPDRAEVILEVCMPCAANRDICRAAIKRMSKP